MPYESSSYWEILTMWLYPYTLFFGAIMLLIIIYTSYKFLYLNEYTTKKFFRLLIIGLTITSILLIIGGIGVFKDKELKSEERFMEQFK